MDNKRIHVMLIIGSDSVTTDQINNVLLNLSERYGGATLSKATGTWAENGSRFGTTYRKIATERAYRIDLCVMPADYDLEFIQRACLPVHPDAQWIHCEIWETSGLHFDVSQFAA